MSKNKILVPDLSAIRDVDLAQCMLDYGLLIAKRLLAVAKTDEEREQREADVKEAQEAVDAYETYDDAPMVVIGYLPPAKRSYLLNAGAAAQRDADKVPTVEQMNNGVDITREWVQWGVKGHRNISGYPYSTKTASAGNREHQITRDDCVDIYEQIGALHALEAEIVEFNFLDSKKKTNSQSTSTDETVTSTAPDAKATTT